MKIEKTANKYNIKLSKADWIEIGKKNRWIESQVSGNILNQKIEHEISELARIKTNLERSISTNNTQALRSYIEQLKQTAMSLEEFFQDKQLFASKKKKNKPCWKNYEMVGTKKKDGREVPNCVPKKTAQSDWTLRGNEPLSPYETFEDTIPQLNETEKSVFFEIITPNRTLLPEVFYSQPYDENPSDIEFKKVVLNGKTYSFGNFKTLLENSLTDEEWMGANVDISQLETEVKDYILS